MRPNPIGRRLAARITHAAYRGYGNSDYGLAQFGRPAFSFSFSFLLIFPFVFHFSFLFHFNFSSFENL
jgi:RsiW-degrading membrane proteinase PrsW (M82 family)